MRLLKFLKERFLLSDFKFGFELEGCIKNFIRFNDDDYYDDEDNELTDKLINNLKYLFGKGVKVIDDTSIKPNSENDSSFEMKSEIYQVTPQNIQNVINGLSKLESLNIYTNESCGFHVHISFPYIDDLSASWIILNIAMDTKFQEKILKFKKFNFFDSKYADKSYLDKIKDVLNKKNYDDLRHLLNTKKYQVFRMHPQGTIEWRGPRNFLNKINLQMIKDFFMLFIEYIQFIRNALDKNSINNFTQSDLKNLNISVGLEKPSIFNKKQNSDIAKIFMNKYKSKFEKIENILVTLENDYFVINGGNLKGNSQSYEKIKFNNVTIKRRIFNIRRLYF